MTMVIDMDEKVQFKQDLVNIAMTTLSSKLLTHEKFKAYTSIIMCFCMLFY